MKSILFATAFLILSSLSAVAQGPYLAADLGPAVYHDSDFQSDNIGEDQFKALNYGFGLDIAGGYSFNANIRTEAEISYRYAHIDKIKIGTGTTGVTRLGVLGLFANGYYDITQFDLPVIPYVGFGLGVLNGEVKVINSAGSYNDTIMGYQAMIGATYRINDRVSVNGGYKLQAATRDFDGTISGVNGKTPYLNSNLVFGTRYNF